METRTVHDPFFDQTVKVSNRLVDRLRGRYASGPTLANGEPEFGWREFQTPPIQHEAADEIERLRKALQQIIDESDSDDGLTAWDGADIARDALAYQERAAEV